jgi:hypothetical protein
VRQPIRISAHVARHNELAAGAELLARLPLETREDGLEIGGVSDHVLKRGRPSLCEVVGESVGTVDVEARGSRDLVRFVRDE